MTSYIPELIKTIVTNEYTISVSVDLYDYCEQKIKYTDFETVDQYVQFILSEIIKDENKSEIDINNSHDITEDQLEALGYLDP